MVGWCPRRRELIASRQGCPGRHGGHHEIDGYGIIRLQSSADQGSPTQTAQNVGVNVGVASILTGKPVPAQSV